MEKIKKESLAPCPQFLQIVTIFLYSLPRDSMRLEGRDLKMISQSGPSVPWSIIFCILSAHGSLYLFLSIVRGSFSNYGWEKKTKTQTKQQNKIIERMIYEYNRLLLGVILWLCSFRSSISILFSVRFLTCLVSNYWHGVYLKSDMVVIG